MININEITIRRMQEMFQNKSLTVKELVQSYIDRIHDLDEGQDGLNSVIEINPDALSIADELDKQGYQSNLVLYGVPVLIKDNIATDDRMHTSAGSLALKDSYAGYDADLVKMLRKNGAVILGKTNLTEFANYMTQDMPNGYSSRGGQVKNPYNKERDPLGSSAGSGVSVAANLCATSIGSDTCNSIVAPGLANGIVGFRPSTGVISQKGIIPISFTLDTAGPFSRTVEDAAIMQAGLTDTPVVIPERFDVKGMIIGYNDWDNGELTEETVVITERMIKELENQGAIIKRISIPETKYIMDTMKYEFKYAMNQYLSTLPKDYPIKTLKDIIDYNELHKEEALRYGQTFLIDAEENTTGNLTETAYKELLEDRKVSMLKIREQLKDMDLCIMLSYNNILQYTALPVITIPCGLYEDGMPFGLQITAITDEQLLKHSYVIEKAVGQRVEPKLFINK
ncbi:hypothetical protein I5677_06960 [Mobilitalea sibirica]|uniref:Amidase domain-containing protein n=1 Tax=Mobilitalea sibirica TaxID=1462919 RepID=A0A8J7HDD1_9FIRM|nr:amidase family protein [Mobilitalea sibirica]MBH1940624.1 hypothetical protein [Mobilitalea sibirica]